LNDSQHIGQSRPSSLLVHEETSSSEQSGFDMLHLDGCTFFFKLPAMAFDAKLHMMPLKNKPEEMENFIYNNQYLNRKRMLRSC
jgi:hypothetical protein